MILGTPTTLGMWLSLVEHCVRDAGAGGSNPLIPTIFQGNYCKTRRLSSNSLLLFVTSLCQIDTRNNRFFPTPTSLYHKIVTTRQAPCRFPHVTICQISFHFSPNIQISLTKKFKNFFLVISMNYGKRGSFYSQNDILAHLTSLGSVVMS